MFSPFFSFHGFGDDGTQQGYTPVQGVESVDDLWSSYSSYHDGPYEKGTPLPSSEQQCLHDFAVMDDMQLDTLSAAIRFLDKPVSLETQIQQPVVPEISELLRSKEEASPAPSSSLELLSNYRCSYNRLNGEKLNEPTGRITYSTEGGNELSTEEVMRMAAARFVQTSTHKESYASTLGLPFGFSYLLRLTDEEIKNIDLANRLLAAAEKLSNRQYDRASNLLSECYKKSSDTGNPVQRVVYYFTDALQERINRETGLSRKVPKDGGMVAEEVIKTLSSGHPMFLELHQKLPFSQIVHFTSAQAILDNVATARKVHLIDLSIKNGLPWIIVLQSLSTRSNYSIDCLKISGIGSSEEEVTATGNRLVRFAETLGLPLSFKAVIVSDFNELKEDMLELEEDEVIGVYSSLDMNNMIARPDRLENTMRVIQKLKPCIMTVADVEAKHNSPSFINRFAEALFHYGASFDFLDNFMDRDEKSRIFTEKTLLSAEIQSIIVTEGHERVIRQVEVSVWRSFFARYGLVETELNEWSLYQASLLAKQFPNGHLCTFDKNGKALTMGWKGTPLLVVSAWKFQ